VHSLLSTLIENKSRLKRIDTPLVALKLKSLVVVNYSHFFILSDVIFLKLINEHLRNALQICRANLIEVFSVGFERYPASMFSLSEMRLVVEF
jgi:hypothetical protein